MRRLAPTILLTCTALFVAACGDQPAVQQATVQPVKPPAPVILDQAKPQAAAPAAAAAAPSPVRKADSELSRRVKRALEAQAAEIAQGIDVSSSPGGVVRLWGTVGSTAALKSAERLAASIPGVSAVENKLVVVRGS